ncbi:MAG: hypothetical protein GY723_05095 [bacterium]|nr:hypothetical protein [bacterium]
MSLNTRALALASGLVWGVGLFLLTWWIIAFDGTSTDVTWIGRVYRGYSLTPAGSVAGLAWGFADGVLFGAIFAGVYNLLAGASDERRQPV